MPFGFQDLVKLTRISTSVLAACVVMLPIWYHSKSLSQSILLALPILTTSMCGFIINDIEDAEKDAINHPDRPIPTGRVSESTAVGLYFSLLAITLILIKSKIDTQELFFYLLFIVLVANYSYVVERAPKLKNLYVAAAAVVPVQIVLSYLQINDSDILLPTSVFLFVAGRELLMDLLDRDGDGLTFAKALGDKYGALLAFTLQLISLILLIPIAKTTKEIAALSLMLVFFGIYFFLWTRVKTQLSIIQVMKLQLILGFVFLIP